MPARRATKPNSLKALFIGNSFTARNDLPGLIERLAAASGARFVSQLISAGGASLNRHWNAGKAVQAIKSGEFDFIVLQEQSTRPIKNPRLMHESIRLYDPVIREAGSKMALYLTWARKHAPAPKSQNAINDAYTSIARELGATVVPVGIAWQRYLAAHAGKPPIELHAPDGSHPSLAGSYLAACVFLETLFGQRPKGVDAELAAKGLSADDQVILQRAATDAAG